MMKLCNHFAIVDLANGHRYWRIHMNDLVVLKNGRYIHISYSIDMKQRVETPLVSVIIPTYNRGWCLNEALNRFFLRPLGDMN